MYDNVKKNDELHFSSKHFSSQIDNLHLGYTYYSYSRNFIGLVLKTDLSVGSRVFKKKFKH